MLKSTYTAAAPLPAGWSEHKAPAGHTYYYNVETKQSTFKRPVVEDEDVSLQIDYSATQPNIHASALVDAQGYSTVSSQFSSQNGVPTGRFNGSQSYFDRSRRREDNDRPKSKAQIPNSEPWVLVKTKLGRRFVHNPETKESFWKFPQDVMMAVIEMDRLEWDAKRRVEQDRETATTTEKTATSQTNGQTAAATETFAPTAGEDSDSYEEVEITDSEAEGDADPSRKRPKANSHTEDKAAPAGPVEFTEEDMAFQLAQMGQEYDLDPSDFDAYENDDEDGDAENEEGQDGLTLTESESVNLFKSLLSTIQPPISPYWTFERVLETTPIASNNRYLALPTTQRRREVFSEWAKEQIHIANGTTIDAHHVPLSFSNNDVKSTYTTKTSDPMTSYLHFLSHQPPSQIRKLYWAEFKRKFRKEPIMSSLEPNDKQKELLFRDFVAKLKTNERERRKDLGKLVKDTIQRKEDVGRDSAEYKELRTLQEESGGGADGSDGQDAELKLTTYLPIKLTQDVRYWVVSDVKDRWGIIDAHVASLAG